MAIRVLPPEVVAKIAAGEVVERPASVVKELIENAIDAGATDIKVEVRQGGRRLLRVIDNGLGIPADEVELAFARHSTSKLCSVADLSCITTLGFRGEALPSIAAVSRVTMATRTADELVGTLLRLENGVVVHREGKGCPQGTVVTVENLFQNVPARLKFLRSPATEAKHISDLVSCYTMAYPELRFSLLNDGRMIFRSTGSGELYDVLIEIYGLEVAQQMLKLEAGSRKLDNSQQLITSIQVYGYISSPSLHRSNRKHITFLVNRRWVHDRGLSYAVSEAYHTLLPTGRYPIVVLNIALDPATVDVNVHPTKREVRFLRGDEVFVAVQRAVRHTLIAQAPVPTVTPHPRPQAPDWERRRRLVEAVKGGRGKKGQLALEVQRTADALRPAAFEVPRVTKLPMLRVLGQMAQTYIIAEGPEGMYLIDQHAAHERVLYERLMAERARMAVTSQMLLEPLTLELTPQQRELFEPQLATLAELGFDIVPFGERIYLVKAMPAILKEAEAIEAIADIIDQLSDGGSEKLWEERIVVSLACHGAVKAGQSLSMKEMQDLIQKLEQTALPHTCPHGRPTMILMSATQLEREFGRR